MSKVTRKREACIFGSRKVITLSFFSPDQKGVCLIKGYVFEYFQGTQIHYAKIYLEIKVCVYKYRLSYIEKGGKDVTSPLSFPQFQTAASKEPCYFF